MSELATINKRRRAGAFKRHGAADAPLLPRERLFAELYAVHGYNQSRALRGAGYPKGSRTNELLERPNVARYVAELREDTARRLNITREKITDGILEAIERAKLISEPATEIRGWRELGLLCGFYDEALKSKELTENQRRVLDKISQLSEQQLLALAAEPIGEVIDGESRALD